MDKLGDNPSSLLGEVLGSFSIESLIKETGKSLVFKAFDLNLKRSVALKVLKPGQDDKRKEQFVREGRRLAELGKHKNITTVYSAGQESGHSYIAMELVEGGDLEDLVAREKLSLSNIFDIVRDIGDAVIYSNGKGIIHRDLKLENVRRNKAGGFYVLDFGDRLTLGENYNDAVGLGHVLAQLLRSVGKYPGLEKIVDNALERRYDSPEDFLAAFGDYSKSITRRKMLKVIGGVAAGIGLGAFALGRWSYERSIESIVDKLEGNKTTDKNTDNLFGELLLRITTVKKS